MNHDRLLGRMVSRRAALALFRATGAAMLVGCMPRHSNSVQLKPSASASTASTVDSAPLPGCVVRPAQTEGPYFVDETLDRSDVRSDTSTGVTKEGVPLQLTFRVSQMGGTGCTPLAGAIVDIWHCDAVGMYSNVTDRPFNTVGQTFLRGYQVTDRNGLVQFTSIYPGWYPGRTVHIHFKIRTSAASGSSHEFTSQLYFDDSITDQVHTQAPYASKGQRTVRNDRDGIFREGGNQLLLTLREANRGYAATFDVGLQMG
ncbi:intradiol ring-cleavage dioxygenase [Oculatella sp. LEGE 06141]|uniref:intradiol ring-cleavage dioxygenase n=1 Tax=Oculatella sp. LEGE 06141 TaxID=1828648 RepID=UPI00351C9AC6